MPDFAMCEMGIGEGGICHRANTCRRSPASGTRPGDRQPWADWWTTWVDGDPLTCEGYWPAEETEGPMNTPHDDIMDALEVISVMLALILVEVCRIAGDPLTAVIFGSLSVAYVLSWHVKRRFQRKMLQKEARDADPSPRG